jgi:hypothetical protein
MRRFSYEGDHGEVALYGVTFPQGVPVEVADAFLLKKLEGNSHFREHAEPTEAERLLKDALAESMQMDPPDLVALPVRDLVHAAPEPEPIPSAAGEAPIVRLKRKYTRKVQ